MIFSSVVGGEFMLPRLTWRVETIYGRDGEHETPYLTRWRLAKYPDGGKLWLHKFHRADNDPFCHDHTSDFWTYPLNQGYFEEELGLEDGTRMVGYVPKRTWTFRRGEHAHRIIHPGGHPADAYWHKKGGEWPLWTLVHIGPPRRDWGFWVPPLLAYKHARCPDDVLGWINDKNDRPKWVRLQWRRYVFSRQYSCGENDGRHQDARARG